MQKEFEGNDRRKEIQHITEMLTAIQISIENLNGAFPDGPIEHRRAHEAMINAAKAEERFWSELKLDIAKKGVWSLLIIILGLCALGFAAKFGHLLKG
jgi:hypothetical protein